MDKRIHRLVLLLSPMIFCGNITLNFITVLLHIDANESIRQFGVYGLMLIVCILSLIGTNWHCKRLMIVYAVGIFYGGIEIVRLWKIYSWNVAEFLSGRAGDEVKALLILCVMAWVVSNDRLADMLRINRYYVRANAVIALIYIVYRIAFSQGDTFFFWIDYMSLAYMFFFSLTADVIRAILFPEKWHKDWVQYICWCALIIGIFGADCKGTLLCACWMTVSVLIGSLFFRKWKRTLIIALILTASVLIGFTVTRKISGRVSETLNEFVVGVDMNRFMGRIEESIGISPEEIQMFHLDSLKSVREWAGRVTTEGEYLIGQYPQYSNPISAVVSSIFDGVAVSGYRDGSLQIDRKMMINILSDAYLVCATSLSARYYLFGSAINEICQSPILGNGLFSFQSKYGTYTHCIVLEVVADIGVLGILVAVFSFLAIIYILCRYGKASEEGHLCYFIALLAWFSFLGEMVSGEIYSYRVIIIYMLLDIMAALMLIRGRQSGNRSN